MRNKTVKWQHKLEGALSFKWKRESDPARLLISPRGYKPFLKNKTKKTMQQPNCSCTCSSSEILWNHSHWAMYCLSLFNAIPKLFLPTELHIVNSDISPSTFLWKIYFCLLKIIQFLRPKTSYCKVSQLKSPSEYKCF